MKYMWSLKDTGLLWMDEAKNQVFWAALFFFLISKFFWAANRKLLTVNLF